MSGVRQEWRIYERLVARLVADQVATDLCVTPNAFIRGRITGVRRQIDVLIEARNDSDNNRRIIVDAKRRKRKLDVKDVESFRGMMEDVDASHGYLVCPRGHTPAAERRAQTAVRIRLLPPTALKISTRALGPAALVPSAARDEFSETVIRSCRSPSSARTAA